MVRVVIFDGFSSFYNRFSGFFVHLNFTYVINVVHCGYLFGFIHVGLGARLVVLVFLLVFLCAWRFPFMSIRVFFGIVTGFWSTFVLRGGGGVV